MTSMVTPYKRTSAACMCERLPHSVYTMRPYIRIIIKGIKKKVRETTRSLQRLYGATLVVLLYPSTAVVSH